MSNTNRPIIVTCVSFYTGATAWGADRSFVESLEQLRARGVDCRVIFPKAGGMGHDLVKAAGFPVKVIDFKSSVYKVGAPWKRRVRNVLNRIAALRIAAVARAWGSDVIYSNTLSIATGSMAARFARLPHVWHIRELGEEDHGWHYDFGARTMARWIGRSQGLVANSHAVASKFARVTGRNDIEVIHNSVALRPYGEAEVSALVPLKGDPALKLVLSGRFAPGKGQTEAIEALAILRKRGVDAGLWLVGHGDGGYRNTLEQAAAQAGVTDHVTFTGYVVNPAPYLHAADVVMTCSRVEAFGRTTVEGMLAGRAVVATNSGGTPELIRDGETGLLYPPGDANALADRIQSLAIDPAGRAAMGRAALAYATAAFAPRQYGDRLVSVLRHVAGRAVSDDSVTQVPPIGPAAVVKGVPTTGGSTR